MENSFAKVRSHYSVALCLGKDNNPVCNYKKELSKALGRTDRSLSAEPHITFNSFLADDRELGRAKNHLTLFSKPIEPFTIHLNRFDVFEKTGSQVAYLALDEQSEEHVKRLMKLLHSTWAGRADKTYVPHVTIARDLLQDELSFAKALFLQKQVEISFECNSLALRRIRKGEFQYSTICTFNFAGLKENLLFE